MSAILTSSSRSAPKISYFSTTNVSTRVYSNASQGSTPTLYCVSNFPIDIEIEKEQQKIFFDKSHSILELQMLGQDSPLEPINQAVNESVRKAKSECRNFAKAFSFGLAKKDKIVKRNFFYFSHLITEEEEKIKFDNKKLEIRLDLQDIKLQPPPIQKLKKRHERCALPNEVVDELVLKGEIKKYNLKGRFGIITANSEKFTVYEDDLLISGVHIRRFKKAVSKKESILIEFKIKRSMQETEKNRIQVVNVVYQGKN